VKLPQPRGRIAGCGWLLAALAVAGCAQQPPDLVIISVDTLRADAVELVDTPSIDRIAASGTSFASAIAPVPRTTPALASMLTGLEPGRHGSREVGDPIRDDVVTLAERLRDRGYETLAVSANLSAGRGQGLDRGFDRFVGYNDLIDLTGDRIYRDLTDVPPDEQGWAGALTDQALELLAGRDRDRPTFLWLFYFDPHFMYRPPSPWQEAVDGAACWQLYDDFMDRRHQAGQIFFNVGGVAERANDACRRLYHAEVAYTDHQIGRILAALEQQRVLDDAVVIFTADHGENFGEGELWFEHGDNAHDAGLLVPLTIAGPGVAAGRTTHQLATLADLTPTVLGLLGLEPDRPTDLDGTDLGPWLRDPPAAATDRIAFAESATPIWNEAVNHVITGRTWGRTCINGPRYTLCSNEKYHPGTRWLYDHVEDAGLEHDIAAEHPEVVDELELAWRRWPPETARERVARTTRFKLVERPRLDGGYDAELYDLAADPDETIDVSDRYPDELRRLRQALDGWTSTLPPLGDRLYDPEVEEMLRTLGYAG
jgi:arylsulfatase A-like enzyme